MGIAHRRTRACGSPLRCEGNHVPVLERDDPILSWVRPPPWGCTDGSDTGAACRVPPYHAIRSPGFIGMGKSAMDACSAAVRANWNGAVPTGVTPRKLRKSGCRLSSSLGGRSTARSQFASAPALAVDGVAQCLLLALNEGAREAAMAMVPPVPGFRPSRAGRALVANVPKPAMFTASPPPVRRQCLRTQQLKLRFHRLWTATSGRQYARTALTGRGRSPVCG